MFFGQVKMRDRRVDTRYSAASNVFAVLHSGAIIVTSLTDINMNGLAFEYVTYGEKHLHNAMELDIFCCDDDGLYDFHLQNVPFEIISETAQADDTYTDPIVTKRYGVRFGKLTPGQASRLEHFIRYHTTGAVQQAEAIHQ